MKHVLLTQSEPRGPQQRDAFRAAGWDVRWHPLLEIKGLNAAPLSVTSRDVLFVVSGHAVSHLSLEGEPAAIIAPGVATANYAEEKFGCTALAPENGQTSEAVWADRDLRDLLENAHSVTIVAGQDGREFLQQRLEREDVPVDRYPVYERVAGPAPDEALQQWITDTHPLLQLLSEAALQTILDWPDAQKSLWQQLTAYVPSKRIAAAAEQAGWQNVRVSTLPNPRPRPKPEPDEDETAQ